MTVNEFCSSQPLVARMREILTDETFQLAILTLKDANSPKEAIDTDDALVSVRRHSRTVGFNTALAALLAMGNSYAEPVKTDVEEAEYSNP